MVGVDVYAGPVNICLLIGQLSYGGAERQVVNLAKSVNRDCFSVNVCVLSPLLDLALELEKASIPVRVIRKDGRYDLSVVPRLARFFKDEKIRLVHTFLYSANVVGALAAVIARIPVVISERSAPPSLGFEKRVMYRLLGRLSDAIVANSQAGKRLLVEQGGIPSEKVWVHYNGVDLSKFEAILDDIETLRGRYAIPKDRFVVGTVGRLIRVKNHELVLRAAARMREIDPRVHFVVVGDVGPGEDSSYRDYLFSLQKSLGLEDVVTFTGMLSDVGAFLRLFDLFVLTSLWEGTPNALLEAMACGLPIVATNVGDVGRIVADAGCGLIVDPEPEAFSEAISCLLSNEEVRAKMGIAGRRYIRANFSLERLAAKTQELWQGLLTKRFKL